MDPLRLFPNPTSLVFSVSHYGQTTGALVALALALGGSAPAWAAATFYGVGDLPGGMVFSQVRDATKAGGVLYAVGSSTANPGSTSGDTAILWSSTAGLVALPNLVANSIAGTFIGASALTPDAAFIASRARSVSQGGARSAVRVTRAGLVNLNLGTVGGLTGNSAATAISADGSILYGLGNNLSQAVRFTAAGPTATLIPYLNPGDTRNFPAGRGTSADGSVMVGWSSGPTSVRAFRYLHGAGVSALPLLAGGTWNQALALTPDARLTLLAGDSPQQTNGTMYLHDATTGTLQPLGSPAEPWHSPTMGGVTADGAVVALTFGQDEVVGPRDAYFRNRHGWWLLSSALAAEGVNLTAAGWRTDSVLGVSPDGTLVFGEGRHHGDLEGYVAEFPPGFLAEFHPVATPPANPAIVGTWRVGDPTAGGSVVLFLADGTYFQIHDANLEETGLGGADGFERGTYRWDAATGELTVVTSIDTNGNLGLSDLNGVSGFTVKVSGDTAIVHLPGETDFPISRVTRQSGTLSGGWQVDNSGGGEPHSVVVFLANGQYFQADGRDPAGLGGDANGRDGMEHGTYTWNAATGAFSATPMVDTNGDRGLSETGPTATLHITADQSGLSYTDHGETLTASRVAPVIPTITLSIELHGDNILLTWPSSATGYGVQGAAGLTSTDWQPVAGTPVMVDGVNQLTVTPAGLTQWFRLFKAE